MIGVLVFRGTDDVTRVRHYKDAFAVAFSPERNRHAWAVVGAAPLTRSCLSFDKVRHDCEDDPLNSVFKQIEESNHNACALLTARGLNGDKMKVRLRNIKKTEAKPVTVPYTKERQEALLKAKTHCLRFLETGGGTLSSDDGFIAATTKSETESKSTASALTASSFDPSESLLSQSSEA